MKPKPLNFAVFAFVAVVLAITACKKTATVNGDRATSAGPLPSLPIKHVSGVIGDRTFDKDTIYKLDGVVYVSGGNKTLTIEPGTWITNGNKIAYPTQGGGTDSLAGVLVITRGNKINAVGTATSPIVFTSDKSAGSRKAGDFGGIIINGFAPVNKVNPKIWELPAMPPVSIAYGGCVSLDNSGRMQYVRIEFSKVGLSFNGIGSGTVVDHIQLSYSAGDAYRYSGGNVNSKFLIALGTADDDFDFDKGYTGNIQFAVGLKDPASTHSSGGSNGVECANERDSISSVNRPYTNPQLSNFTLLGAANSSDAALFAKSMHIRPSASFTFKNSVAGGYRIAAHFENIISSFNNGAYDNCTMIIQPADTADYTDNVTAAYITLFNNAPVAPGRFSSTEQFVGATNPSSYLLLGPPTAPNPFYPNTPVPYSLARLAPKTTSPAFNGASFVNLGSFFSATTYQGAVAPTGAAGVSLWNIPGGTGSTPPWVDWTPNNDSNY